MKIIYIIVYFLVSIMIMGQIKLSQSEYYRFIEENKQIKEQDKDLEFFYRGYDKPFYTILPLITNNNYSYVYLINSNLFIEKNLKDKDEIYLFNSYEELREYYLALNKRVLLPNKLEDLYQNSEYLLAKNYIQDELRILNFQSNIEYYLNIIFDEIFGNVVNIEDISISDLENYVSPEVSYSGTQKYEIPLLVYFGEYLKRKYSGKWVIYEGYNELGEVFYYPDLIIEDKEVNLWESLRKVLYNEKNDKIFNFEYLLRYDP